MTDDDKKPDAIVTVIAVPQKIYFIGPVTIEKKDWFGETSVEERWPESDKSDD